MEKEKKNKETKQKQKNWKKKSLDILHVERYNQVFILIRSSPKIDNYSGGFINDNSDGISALIFFFETWLDDCFLLLFRFFELSFC